MPGREDSEDELKNELLQMKRHIQAVNSENQILKVKMRKVQAQMVVKDRQIEALLDPKKSENFRKLLSDKGASMILNLREQVKVLEKALLERDAVIKKLQTEKIYGGGPKLNSRIKPCKTTPDCRDGKGGGVGGGSGRNRMRCMYGDDESDPCNEDVVPEDFIDELEKEINSTMLRNRPMETIKEFENEDCPSQTEMTLNKGREGGGEDRSGIRSPNSDLERSELFSNSPHEEIRQLHTYFVQILAQIDSLKSTVNQVKVEQEKTDSLLHKKSTVMTKLYREIKQIKKNYANNEKFLEQIRSASAISAKSELERPVSKGRQIHKQRSSTGGNAKSEIRYYDLNSKEEIREEGADGGGRRRESSLDNKYKQKTEGHKINARSKSDTKPQPKKRKNQGTSSDASVSSGAGDYDA